MNKVKSFFIKVWEFIKKFHWYGWVGMAVAIGFMALSYFSCAAINQARGTYTYAWIPKINAIDDCFPLIPFFILIYYYYDIFLLVGFLAVALTDKSNFFNTIITSLTVSIIAFIIFMALPTRMDRVQEGLIDAVNKPGFLYWLLAMTYSNDGGNYGQLLFPSLHCAMALNVALGTFRRKDSPLWWRIITIISVVLISLSTLYTKQHYFVDIIGGLGITIIVFYLIKLFNPGKYISEKIEAKKIRDTNIQ